MVEDTEWTANDYTLEALRDGRVFPYTPEGKKAAEIRARRDYVPGWQDDVNKLNDAFNTPGVSMSRSIQDALHIFLNKYTKKQNHD